MTFRIRFAKYGVVKFIGHLDVMRYFQKVIRRSELPVKYSQGFNPHQLLGFAQPLGVGITSDGEYMEVEFDDDKMMALAGIEPVSMREIGNGLVVPITNVADAPKLERIVFDGMQKETYEGFAIKEVKLLPPPRANVRTYNAMALVNLADYMVSVKTGYSIGMDSPEALLKAWEAFMAQDTIKITKKTKKSETELDLKEHLNTAEPDEAGTAHADVYESNQRLFMRLTTGSVVNIRPELVLEAFCAFIGQEYNSNAFQIHRMNTFFAS